MALLGLAVRPAAANEPVFDFQGAIAGEHQLPRPWMLLGHPRADTPSFTVQDDAALGRVLCLHAKGNQSDGVYRPVNIDLARTPVVNFHWKVTQHPAGQVGTAKSDQAVKVQLDFGRYGLKRRVLSYVFDSQAQAGAWHDDSSFFAGNSALVLDSGSERLNTWIGHSRNVREDYQALYRAEPPVLQNLAIFCDSNDSNSEAIGYCAAITFSRQPIHPEGNGER